MFRATCGFDGLGNHALYFLVRVLCGWNWGRLGVPRLHDQLLYELLPGGVMNQFIPHLFVHNWSLAVEVHYYILWDWQLFLA